MDIASTVAYVADMPAAAPNPEAVVPLREARRDFTRAHICSAAREVFFVRGFAAPTMEQIAQAAGIQRSTLYTHYRDKEEILAAITADYTRGLRGVIARLPGPTPSRAELARWVGEFAAFARDQRAPTELLVTASSVAHMPEPLRTFGNDFLEMLAARLPAFRRALDVRDGLDHAWAMAALRELGWALCFYAQHGETEDTRNRLAVATTLIVRFVHGEC
ncbi:TetR/AcrR family transcriptional regulator [Sphingomonas solaris]|nr:TetR/AcrR family transcriptional regulator [Sphingomonas solaris]